MIGTKIMMNYIEELIPGNIFDYQNNKFILTTDFKKNNSKLAINLINGSPKWFNSSDIISRTQVYYLDSDNNIIPLTKDSSSNETHINIS